MAIEPVPSIVALYSPVPDRQTQQGNELSNNMDGFSFSLGPWGDSIKLIGDNVENNATEAENFATASSGYADDSATSAAESLASRNEAQTAANTAVSSVASLPDGLIDTNDDFDDITNTWNKPRIALETNSAPYKPVIDLDFARDNYKSYVGLAAGWQTAPLLDLATFTRVGDATGVNAFGILETVGTDQPRVVFENGVARGILIEGDGENLAIYSEGFSHADWGKNGVTVDSNATTAPDGELTADRMTKDASSFRFVYQTISVSTAGVHYVYFYVKEDTLSKASIVLTGDNATTLHGRVIFDLDSNTATDESSTNLVDAYIEDATNGFKKIVVVADLTVVTNVKAILYPDVYSNTVAGSIFAWGGQLGEGYPSSYIKTTSTPVSRNKDIFDLDLTGKLNTQHGSFFISGIYPADDGNLQMMMSTGSSNNEFRVLVSTPAGSLFSDVINAGDNGQANLGLRVAGEGVKVLVSYEKTSSGYLWKSYANGGDAVTFTTTDIPTMTNVRLGDRAASSGFAWDSTISRFQYYTNVIPEALAKSWTGV